MAISFRVPFRLAWCSTKHLHLDAKKTVKIITQTSAFMYPGNLSGRYQFFKERPLSIPLFTDSVTWQKIRYTHENPTQPRWQLCAQPEDYKWSSAAFYTHGDAAWPFLTHFWYGDDWPLLNLNG